MQYEDFVIQIGRDDGDGHRLRVLQSPAGQGAGRLCLPPELRGARLARSASGTTRRAPQATRHLVPPAPPEAGPVSAQTLGEGLFDALFSGQVRSLYDQSLGALRGRSGCGLRIKLKLDPTLPDSDDLQALPWELMRRAETQEFLSLSRLSPVVRYLDVPRPTDVLRLPRPLRLMALISSPRELEELDVKREQEQLEKLELEGAIKVSYLEQAVPEKLRRALVDQEIHILHFMGHGGFEPESGEGVLYFVSPDGGALPISGGTLATKLRDVTTLRLAVLNACETARASQGDANPFAGVANALVLGGVPAVVAMQAPITDDAAIGFSEAFYRRLAVGDSVDAALTEGRQAVHSVAPRSAEWSTPVLFLRIPDGKLFDSEPAEATATTPIVAPTPKRHRALPWIFLAFVTILALTYYAIISGVWPDLGRQPSGATEIETAGPALPQTGKETLEKEQEPEPVKKPLSDRQLTSSSPSPSPPPPPPKAESRPAHAEPPAGKSILASAVSFGTSVPGFRGRLDDVLLLDKGRLCWKLTLRNGSQKRIESGFDPTASYLADERGNRYAIVDADVPLTGPSLDSLVPRASQAYWLVFDPPLGATQRFLAFLRSADRSSVRFDPFRVELDATVGAAGSIVEPSLPAGALPLEVDVPAVGVHGCEGLEVRVSSLALLAADLDAGRPQSRIRWALTLHNTSVEALSVGLALPAVYLEDELGNIYSVLSSSAGERPREGRYVEELSGGLRLDTWLEFPAPRPGAHQLTAHIASHDPSRLQFDEISIALPEIAATYRYTPHVLGFRAEREGRFGATLDGLEARLVEVERLENGRLRWQLELRNDGASELEIGFDFKSIQLADGSRSYRLLASDTGLDPDQIYTERLAPGGRVFHWLDFAEPPASANDFQLILVSHDRSYSYRPLLVELYP